MCILFSYIARSLKPNEFKLVVLSNRDEYHHRSSKPAGFVTPNNLYGIDLTPGKEGGTWLGMNRSGKLGLLLNLDRNEFGFEENKSGRGVLVPDYLNSTMNSEKYIDSIRSKASEFNPFNLILYEKNKSTNVWDCNWFNNLDCEPCKLEPNQEYFSISNHVYKSPYPKTVTGEGLFKQVIEKFNKTSEKQQLINSLIEVAKYNAGKKFEPYMVEDSEARKAFLREQVFIDIPVYGTRTHTVILVDDQNQCLFYERTMKCPIDGKNPQWIENQFEIKIE